MWDIQDQDACCGYFIMIYALTQRHFLQYAALRSWCCAYYMDWCRWCLCKSLLNSFFLSFTTNFRDVKEENDIVEELHAIVTLFFPPRKNNLRGVLTYASNNNLVREVRLMTPPTVEVSKCSRANYLLRSPQVATVALLHISLQYNMKVIYSEGEQPQRRTCQIINRT